MIKRIIRALVTIVLLAATMSLTPTETRVLGRRPSIILSPGTGIVGSTVTVSGTGFAASSTMTISYDGTLQSISPAPVTDSSGSFSTSFTVPPSTAGTHTIAATDSATPPNSASNSFTVTPSITLSSTSGVVGSGSTVFGSGFAGSSTITIRYDGTAQTTFPTPVTTSGSGLFTASFTVPASTGGNHPVTATDSVNPPNSASNSFTVLPSLTLIPTSGVVGSPVTVSAEGFASSHSMNITFDSSIVATGTTNSTGSFTAPFTVPPSTEGVHSVTATTGGPGIATATFTVIPFITLSQTSSVYPSTPMVIVSGSGFAGSSSVTIIFESPYQSSIVNTGTIDSNGSFPISFTVPPSTVGTYTVRAVDGSSNSATAFFTILAPKGAAAAALYQKL